MKSPLHKYKMAEYAPMRINKDKPSLYESVRESLKRLYESLNRLLKHLKV